jgi:hypothetical protein
MSVANMSFMVDRLGADCAPLQYIRELTQNAVESIMRSPDSKGEIHWDVDWNRYLLTGIFKLAVIDNGTGMSGPDMLDYINKLSSSIHEQSKEGNFGIGAKIAAAPKNPAGLVYLSWINGVGSMIHLWKNPDTGVYGLRKFERPDGSAEYWAPVVDDIKPPLIKDHGTMVILLGKDDTENTVAAAAGTPMPSRWVLRYLNTRYARFPKGIVVKSREGWDLPKGDSHNFLRTITGQVPWLNQNSCKSGEVSLTNAVARWYILKPNLDQNSGHLIEGGHMAALYQDELYEMATSRMGVGRLQSFGVIFGHNRVVIYVEPTYEAGQMTPNTARTNLLIDGESLPWADWAAEFREKMPQEIKDLMEEVSAGTETSDHRQSILERLKQIRDLFRFSRYRPASNGKVAIDPETVTIGGKPSESENHRGKSDTAKSGGTGGRAGDIYALFLAAKGIPGEEFQNTQQPDTRWISVAEGTRIQPDLEDRAAKFLPQQNLLLINADFRVFLDMIDRWCKKYSHAPGARPVVEQVVREWFEQQLVEAVLGALAIRGSSQWTLQDTEKLWNEEALTAVILPRYHVDNSIKRALGSKLGSIKELVPSA